MPIAEKKLVFSLFLISEMEAELREAFKKADLDKNGFLSKEEIRKALIDDDPNDFVTEQQIEEISKQLDLNHDGKVSCQGNSG